MNNALTLRLFAASSPKIHLCLNKLLYIEVFSTWFHAEASTAWCATQRETDSSAISDHRPSWHHNVLNDTRKTVHLHFEILVHEETGELRRDRGFLPLHERERLALDLVVHVNHASERQRSTSGRYRGGRSQNRRLEAVGCGARVTRASAGIQGILTGTS